MISRLLLLASLSWIMGLTADLFTVMGMGISGRDLVLLFGGLFLLYKGVRALLRKAFVAGVLWLLLGLMLLGWLIR